MGKNYFQDKLDAYVEKLIRANAEAKRAKQKQELVHMNKREVSTLDRILGRHHDIKGTPVHTYGNANVVIPDWLKRKPKQPSLFERFSKMGRGGDTEMVLVPRHMAELLDQIIHHGHKQINPQTGLREYMWQPDDPNAAKYETSLANQQIQQQGHQQQQIPQENVLLNMRKSLLKNFGRGMPSQVGDTCAMQNSYLNEKFVKSIFDKNKKPIAENIKTNQDQQLLDKSLIKYKDSYDHPVGKIRHNLLYEPEGFSIFKKNKLTPHKGVEDFIQRITRDNNTYKQNYFGKEGEEEFYSTRPDYLLGDAYIQTNPMNKKDKTLGEVMADIQKETTEKYLPVPMYSKVKYYNDNVGIGKGVQEGGHALTILKGKTYTDNDLDQKANKITQKIKAEKDEKRRQEYLNNLLLINKMKSSDINKKLKIYDSNIDNSSNERPKYRQVVVKDDGSAYDGIDNFIENKPFFNLRESIPLSLQRYLSKSNTYEDIV